MERWAKTDLICSEFLVGERTLELYAARGNLPWRGAGEDRSYDAAVAALLFRRRDGSSKQAACRGTLGNFALGDTLKADEALPEARDLAPPRRRRRPGRVQRNESVKAVWAKEA